MNEKVCTPIKSNYKEPLRANSTSFPTHVGTEIVELRKRSSGKCEQKYMWTAIIVGFVCHFNNNKRIGKRLIHV